MTLQRFHKPGLCAALYKILSFVFLLHENSFSFAAGFFLFSYFPFAVTF